MEFYVGLHQLHDCKHFERSFVSVNRLVKRKSNFVVKDWIMDSGAFSQIYNKGEHMPVKDYANLINRFKECGNLIAAVSQDYMCENFILKKTGMTVKQHQHLTIERYKQLIELTDVVIMPVLQGYEPHEYVEHIHVYGDLLKENMYVGVGSVCKRNANPLSALGVLKAIKEVRPDLKLHGFGLKITALENKEIYSLLESSDSMAWSFNARYNGGSPNDYAEAQAYEKRILKLKEKHNL
jgi:hypothetical protein